MHVCRTPTPNALACIPAIHRDAAIRGTYLRPPSPLVPVDTTPAVSCPALPYPLTFLPYRAINHRWVHCRSILIYSFRSFFTQVMQPNSAT